MAIKPKSERVLFRCSPELKERILDCAAAEGKSEADFLRDLLTTKTQYLVTRHRERVPHLVRPARPYRFPKPAPVIEPDFVKPLNIRWPDIHFHR